MQKTTFRLWLSLLAIAFVTLACGLFDQSADYSTDPVNEEFSSANDFISDDKMDFGEEDNLEGLEYYDLPEDCYEDEQYDPVEQRCYPIEETEDTSLTEDEFQEYAEESWSAADSYFDTYSTDDEEQTLVIYLIQGDEISNPDFSDVSDELLILQQDRASQQEIWAYFSGLIPPENRTMLSTYVVMTDGIENTMAAVEQDPDDPDRWMLTVDILDARNLQELTYTLIHEHGHLLTLSAYQVEPNAALLEDPDNDDLYDDAVDACPYYFPGEGCSQPDAYINAFYNRFWQDLYDEWLDIDSILDDDDYYDALDAFYAKYQDQFVSDYAATNPEEDLAETWMYFVLEPKPAGNTVAEQKILFLYEYPELVILREEIAAHAAALSGKD